MATAPTKAQGQPAANIIAALDAEERTPAWLARRIGVARTTLAYQLKHNSVPVETLLLISDVLDRPVERLVA